MRERERESKYPERFMIQLNARYLLICGFIWGTCRVKYVPKFPINFLGPNVKFPSTS